MTNFVRNSLKLPPSYVNLDEFFFEDDNTDNKGMVNINTATSDRTSSPTVRVNIPTSTNSDKNLPKKHPTKINIHRRIRVPFIVNTFLIIFVSSLLVLLEFGFIPGNKQGYHCQDPGLSYKFKGEVISLLVLGIGCFVIPLVAIILTEVLSKKSFKKISASELWYYYKEGLIGCTLVLLLTEIAKILFGEHRPHFFDVCQPNNANTCIPNEFVESFTCTNPLFSNYFLTDASRSFPSGHASLSWFTGTFSAYVIQTRLSTIYTGRLLKPFLVSVCFSWSLLCSLTRITDRRHHWWDVLAGTILGICGAVYTANLVHKKMFAKSEISKVSASTTTLLDVKNKDATSVII